MAGLIQKFIFIRPGVGLRKRGVFQSNEAKKEFISNLMPVLNGNPGKVDAGIREQVQLHRKSLRTRDLGRIYFAIIHELLEHEGEVQQRIFHLLPFLTERGQTEALSLIIHQSQSRSVFIDAVRRIQDLSHYFQRKGLYNRVVRRLKRELNARSRESREDSLKLLLELPVSFRLTLIKFIFRSSYIHHHIQQKCVPCLTSLPADTMVKMIERIVKLRDADEGLVQACINIISSMDLQVRPKVLRILLRHAPYDLVAIRSVEALQYIPVKSVPPVLFENAARTIESSFRLENPALKALAASMISRFPEPYLSRLIRRCLEISDGKTRTIALKYILGLDNEKKISILSYVFTGLSANGGNEGVINKAVRMISTVSESYRSELYKMAASRIRSDLNEIEKQSHLYEGLSVLQPVHLIPDRVDQQSCYHSGKRAIVSVLGDSRKARQLHSLEQVEHLPLELRGEALEKALQAESYEVVVAAGKWIDGKDSPVLHAKFIDQLIRHRLKMELSDFTLQEIGQWLDFLGPLHLIHVFENLRAMRLFPVRDLVREMSERLVGEGLVSRRALDFLFRSIKSDNEKANFLHDFVYRFRDQLGRLSWTTLRPCLRIARERLKKKEKGFTEDMIALFQEIIQNRIDPASEFPVLRKYFQEEELHLFEPMIYTRYRSMTPEQRIDFLDALQTLIDSILYGESYGKLKKRIEATGIENQVNTDFIFAILLQLIPIDSPHMSRQDARAIFMSAVRNESEIQNDLRKVAPGFLDSEFENGFTLARPSFEVRRSQSRPMDTPILHSFMKGLDASLLKTENGIDLLQVLSGPDRGTIEEDFFNYCVHELGENFQELQGKIQIPELEYLSAVTLQELVGEVLRDTLHREINRIRQRIPRNEWMGMVEKAADLLGIGVHQVRYVGKMKPGSLIRLLRKQHYELGQPMESFVAQFTLKRSSGDDSELTWERVIDFLDDPGAGEFQDQGLAAALGSTLQAMDQESLDRSLQQSQLSGKVVDPFRHLVDELSNRIWSPLGDELEGLIHSYDTEETVQVSDISFRLGKSSWLSIYGGLADICIARDARLFAMDHFSLVSMIQDNRFVGFILVHIIDEGDGKMLVLAGCEPSIAYSTRHSPREIYEQTQEILIALAQKGNMQRVVQIADENAYSNRDRIKKYIKSTIADGPPDGKLRKPLYLGSYGVTTFRSKFYYTLWERESSPSGKVGQE